MVAKGHELDAQTIATLGHELQHALEVVRDGRSADGSDVRQLYRRIGYIAMRARGTVIYETHAAVRAGATILRQVKSAREITASEWSGCGLLPPAAYPSASGALEN